MMTVNEVRNRAEALAAEWEQRGDRCRDEAGALGKSQREERLRWRGYAMHCDQAAHHMRELADMLGAVVPGVTVDPASELRRFPHMAPLADAIAGAAQGGGR